MKQIIKNINIFQSLKPLENAIKILRKDFTFSMFNWFFRSPWTLACYMIEGQSSKDFINTRTAFGLTINGFKN